MLDRESMPGADGRRGVPALLDRLDPLLLEAAGEVDRSLLRWALSLTPMERLDACTNAGRALSEFHRVPPETG